MIAPQALKISSEDESYGTVLVAAVESGNCAMIQAVLECVQTDISDPKQVG